MSRRPGRIVAEVAIDAPYPREHAFRTSRTYNEFCRRTSAALAQAMAGDDEE
jgi:NitT/TauT family transport system ATP-binding protein